MPQAHAMSVMSETNILILKSQRQGYKSNTLLNVASKCEFGKCSISWRNQGVIQGMLPDRPVGIQARAAGMRPA